MTNNLDTSPDASLAAIPDAWLPSWLAEAKKHPDAGFPPAAWARAAGPAAGGGLNLDHSHIRYTGMPQRREITAPEVLERELEPGSWWVQQKTVDNYSEFVAVEDPEHDLVRRHSSQKTKVAPVEQMDLEELVPDFDELFRKNAIAARRSKRGLKWAVLGLGGDRIFTLTQRHRIPTHAQASALWSKFEQECSRRFENFKCVMVIEPHTIDGFHIHFVCNRFFDVSSMRLWWHRILTGKKLKGILRGEDSPGNVQIGDPHGTRKIAKYLCKYLAKSFEGLQSVRIKRYVASKGIRPPQVKRSRMASSINGGEMHRLCAMAEADGWKVEDCFEGSVMGRKLLWIQCSRKKKPQPPSILET